MKFKKLKNANRREILESRNNAFMIALAFICALVSWYYVKMKYHETDIKNFTDVAVVADISGTTAEENGLQIINTLKNVNVRFECSSKDYSRVTKNRIIAYVDMKNYSRADEYDIKVQLKSLDNIELSNIKIEPEYIKVVLDKNTPKTVALTTFLPNIIPAEGKALGECICDPVQVDISGPSSIVNKIDRVEVESDVHKILDSKEIIYADNFNFYTEDGTKINTSNITVTPKSIAITIPVYAEKNIPITANFKTQDTNFDQSSLDYTFTPDNITLASDTGESIPDALEVQIPLTDLIDDNGIVYEKDYQIKTQLINQSKLETVHFKLNNTNLGVREMTLSKNNIHQMQVPQDNYDYTNMTEKITVKLVGPIDVINNITASDINANINLTNAESEKLKVFPIDVEVSCSVNFRNVFAIPVNKANISKTLKSESSTQATNKNNTN